MKCSEKLKLVLAGAGGYGRFYLEALARPEILDKAEFSGGFLSQSVSMYSALIRMGIINTLNTINANFPPRIIKS